MANIKPEIKEVSVNDVYGKTTNVVVIPNSILANEEMRQKYIDELTDKRAERIEKNKEEHLIQVLESSKTPKNDLIEEIIVSRNAEFVLEAEEIVDKDHPTYDEAIKKHTDNIIKEEKEILKKKPISEIRKKYVDLKLTTNENLEILVNVYNLALYHCVRLVDNPRKKFFIDVSGVKEDITEETRDILVAEHIRVNTNREEKDAKK